MTTEGGGSLNARTHSGITPIPGLKLIRICIIVLFHQTTACVHMKLTLPVIGPK